MKTCCPYGFIFSHAARFEYPSRPGPGPPIFPSTAQVLPANTLQALSTVEETLYLGNGEVVEQSLRVDRATSLTEFQFRQGPSFGADLSPLPEGYAMWQMGCKLVVGSIPSRASSDVLHDVKILGESSHWSHGRRCCHWCCRGSPHDRSFWRRQLGRHCRWSRCWRDLWAMSPLSEWW